MAKKNKERFVESDYIHVSPKASWIDFNNTHALINCEFHRIMDFYVTFCICVNYATQGRTLSSYGWKEKPWKSDPYLKNKLNFCENVAVCKTKKEVAWKEVKKTIDTVIDSKLQWYESSDEYAIYSKVESNEFMSLFYHIRCALAHGRFAIMTNNNERYYILENGVCRGSRFFVKARCRIREKTLLHWIDVISHGPSEVERDSMPLVMKEIINNPSITEKNIASVNNMTEYEVKVCIEKLKEQIELKYTRKVVGKTGYWEWNDSLLSSMRLLCYVDSSEIENA